MRACFLDSGGRSLALITAIHGIGMDPTTIAPAIQGLFHRAMAPAASNSAGMRMLMRR